LIGLKRHGRQEHGHGRQAVGARAGIAERHHAATRDTGEVNGSRVGGAVRDEGCDQRVEEGEVVACR
jgi:hypothetical protein